MRMTICANVKERSNKGETEENSKIDEYAVEFTKV